MQVYVIASSAVRSVFRFLRTRGPASAVIVLGLITIGLWLFESRPEPDGLRPTSLNNLRFAALASLQYATSNGDFLPPGGRALDDAPRWSWQVQLLPYMDQERLYDRMDLDLPWDSERNRPWTSYPLSFWLNPEQRDPDSLGGIAITHQTANSRVFGPRRSASLAENSQSDGAAQTLMLGEIGAAFPPWAKPGNVRDPARGIDGGPEQWGRGDGSGCNVMFLGGNGRYLSPRIAPEVLELLADPNNGVPDEGEF